MRTTAISLSTCFVKEKLKDTKRMKDSQVINVQTSYITNILIPQQKNTVHHVTCVVVAPLTAENNTLPSCYNHTSVIS